MRVIISCICLLACLQVVGQHYQDVIELHNGTIIRGQTNTRLGKVAIASQGNLWVYDSSEVKDIRIEEMVLVKQPLVHQSEGTYVHIDVGLISSLLGDGGAVGGGIRTSLGYQFNKFMSVGFGTGLEGLDIGFVPAFGEFRLTSGNYSQDVFLAVQPGVAFYIVDGWRNTQLMGRYLDVSTGIRVYLTNGTGMTFAVGYHHSSAKESWENWNGGVTERFYLYNRMTLRIGMMLN